MFLGLPDLRLGNWKMFISLLLLLECDWHQVAVSHSHNNKHKHVVTENTARSHQKKQTHKLIYTQATHAAMLRYIILLVCVCVCASCDFSLWIFSHAESNFLAEAVHWGWGCPDFAGYVDSSRKGQHTHRPCCFQQDCPPGNAVGTFHWLHFLHLAAVTLWLCHRTLSGLVWENQAPVQ